MMNTTCKLLVLEGIHAGAEIVLGDGSYLVGADLACDLVLLDAGVAKQHLCLHVEGMHINAERLGDMPVTHQDALVEKTTFLFRDGDLLRLGTAALRLSLQADAPIAAIAEPPALEIITETALTPQVIDTAPAASGNAPPRQPMRPPRRPRAVLWSLPLVIVLLGACAFMGSRALQASTPQDLPVQVIKAAPVHEKRDELLARVREFIGDDALDVQRDAQGRIAISGEAKGSAMQRQIAEIKNEFKESIEIVDQVTYVSDNKPQKTVRLRQRIMDVHVGEIRWFQTADGMRNFEGSVLEDGAEVVRIGIDGIVFRRNGNLSVFKFSDEEGSK